MKSRLKGFTLVELLIGIAIIGILLALAAPNFAVWIQNSKIRTAAESIQNGLQLARAEAVRRNAQVRFQLTTTLDNDCVLSRVDTNWVVTYGTDDPTANCGKAPMNDALSPSNPANAAPRIIQSRSGAEASGNVVADSSVNFVAFDGLGRGSLASIGIAPATGSCQSSGGGSGYRCLRVTVTNSGRVRLCDPALPSTGTDPQRCLVSF